MGALHGGHLSLVDASLAECDRTVVTIFVNPTQFGPGEDLETYPRNMTEDLRLAEKSGVHCVFAPETAEIYSKEHQTWVEVTGISKGLCGTSRPGHFRGVATVVAKLFNIVQPDIAIFGEKDFQQLQVIKTMVRDLNFPVEIYGHPIVREGDGLAMSSRNSYLSADERKSAICLNRAIDLPGTLMKQGCNDRGEVVGEIKNFIDGYPSASIDYIFLGDPETLTEPDIIPCPALLALAVYIGSTRLIDNSVIQFRQTRG
jgi:pantoate--beta-alanine ligase